MTKPSDFTLNSDYLSIAQVDSNTFTLSIGGGTLDPTNYTIQNNDFSVKVQPGAVDRILIKKDSHEFMLGSEMSLTPTYEGEYPNTKIISGALRVFRVTPSTLRAQLVLENQGSLSASYPSMSFVIKVSSFKAPNVL